MHSTINFSPLFNMFRFAFSIDPKSRLFSRPEIINLWSTMVYLNSELVTMYIQCCLALWSCMPLIHLALVYIVYHFRSQTVICHQSQTVTFVHDKKCFEIDLSNGQISSRMLLRRFKCTGFPNLQFSPFITMFVEGSDDSKSAGSSSTPTVRPW